MDEPEETWLQDLAARVDAGERIDWVEVEAAAGPEAVEVVRALRVIARIASDGRRPDVAVQSAAVTEPLPPPGQPSEPRPPTGPARPDDAPRSDRYRSIEPSPPEEIRRKLLFGVALVLSLASVYAGLLFGSRFLQVVLAGLALAAAVVALFTGARPPAPPPSDPPAPPPPPGGSPS